MPFGSSLLPKMSDVSFDEPTPEELAKLGAGGRRMSKWKSSKVKAVAGFKNLADPFGDIFGDVEAKKAIRHDFNARKETWETEEIEVKILPDSFAEGSLRQAFKAKYIHKGKQWDTARCMVVKDYMCPENLNTYKNDAQVQSVAKQMADKFNSYNPPKKIDFLRMSVIEMTDENCAYHMEAYIDGEYIKHNSNAGFVESGSEVGISRRTPQCFSHFTFVESNFKFMIVDIQGVQDIYTDPQIHTLDGKGYGEGNLGIRGIALFFLSHRCNEYCKKLCLPEVELSEDEQSEAMTRIIQDTVYACTQKMTMKRRTTGQLPALARSNWNNVNEMSELDEDSILEEKANQLQILGHGEHQSHPLALVHYGISDLYCSGWYMDMVEESALFHLKKAAVNYKNLKAMYVLGQKFLGLDTDELEDLELEKDVNAGWSFIEEAAHLGDRNSIWKMGQKYQTQKPKDLALALQWYSHLYKEGVNTPLIRYHAIIAKIAEIYELADKDDGIMDSFVDRREMAIKMYRKAADDARKDGKIRAADKYSDKAELCEESLEGYG